MTGDEIEAESAVGGEVADTAQQQAWHGAAAIAHVSMPALDPALAHRDTHGPLRNASMAASSTKNGRKRGVRRGRLFFERLVPSIMVAMIP